MEREGILWPFDLRENSVMGSSVEEKGGGGFLQLKGIGRQRCDAERNIYNNKHMETGIISDT